MTWPGTREHGIDVLIGEQIEFWLGGLHERIECTQV